MAEQQRKQRRPLGEPRQFGALSLASTMTGDSKYRVPMMGGSITIDHYDGDRGECYIQIGDNPTNLVEVEHHKIIPAGDESWFYIINRSAQTDASIVVTVAPVGMKATPGAGTAAGSPNRPTYICGRVTVGTAETQLSATSITVPYGYSVVIQCITGTVSVIETGDAAAAGVELTSDGPSLSMLLDDLSAVYLRAESAGNVVQYIVEQ